MSSQPSQTRWFFSLAAVLLFSSLVFFQNCGPRSNKAAEATGQSAEPPPDPSIPGPPGPPDFKTGQLFNYDYIPAKTQMVQTMIDSLGYYAHQGAKAVAVAPNGLGFVTRRPAGLQEDASRAALEGCFAISGGKPCSLVAVGHNFAVDLAEIGTSFDFTMSTPTPGLTPEKLPFLLSATRTQVINDYKVAGTPKALAIALDGTYAFVAHTTQFPILSVNEARRLALERCELSAAFSPCTLYALDDQIVFNPLQLNRTPVIDYARTQLATNIPGMREQVFTNNMTNDYLPKVTTQGLSGAIYITADGRGGYATNANAATVDGDARATCDANKIVYPCFRYAINQGIQNFAASLVAISQYSLNTHCKAMPRQTCAHHRAMGCPPGSYYTMSGGGGLPAIENCP